MPKNITIYPDGDGASITVPYFYFDGGTASMTGRVVATGGLTTSFQWIIGANTIFKLYDNEFTNSSNGNLAQKWFGKTIN